MISEIRRAALEALRPVELRPLSRYIEDVVRLPSGLSAVPGAISLWGFQRGICDAMVDPEIEKVTVCKGARLGYSTILAGAVGFYCKVDPSSILTVLPTEDDVSSWIASQLEAIFAVSPELRDAIPTVRRGPFGDYSTKRFRRFPGGSLRVVAARASRNLRAHTARILIVDEADACEIGDEGSPIMLAERRTLSFSDRKILIGSTPGNSTTSIVHNSYLTSDQRIYVCPCPSCGAEHEITWADIRWPEGKPQEAAWCCPSCGVLHPDEYKRDMVEAGRWLVTKPEVKGHAGFRLSCLIAPHAPAAWPKLAQEWIVAKRRPETLKPFVQTILGQVWRDDDEDGVQPHELQALAEPISLESIPEEVLFLTSGVDIQHDRIEISTLGFTEDDEWLVCDHRQLYGDPQKEEIWTDLADFLGERYPHEAGGTLTRDAVCIDAADGQTMQRVLAFCAGHRNLRLIPVKGASGSRPPLTPTASKRNRTLMVCGVDGLKTRLFDRLAKRDGIRFSKALPLAYFEQLAGSERVVVRYSRGQPSRVFERYPGRLAESLDCFVYALAARSAVGANPARRRQEVASRVALKPQVPTTIRSAWLEGRP